MENQITGKKSKIFYGWWIVAACSLISFLSVSSRFSFTMFFPTLISDLGWSRAMLGFGLTLHMWTYAITVVVAGYFVDRFGARAIMVIGGFIIICGLSLTSTMAKVWQFYLYYGVLLAAGVAMTFVVPVLGTVRKWFIKKAGLALAFTTVGGSLGGILMAIIIPDMIASFGWRRSWLYLGLCLGISIVIIAGIIIRKNPESMGLLPDGTTRPGDSEMPAGNVMSLVSEGEEFWTVRNAVRTRSFWCFLIGGAVGAIPGIGITGHVVNWGMDIAKAAEVSITSAMGYIKIAISLSALLTMVGAMIGGPLSDRFGRKIIICSGMVANAIIFLFVPKIHTMLWIVISTGFMGFFGGLIGPVWGAYLGDIFGRYSLATIFSLIVFCIGIVGGTGSVIFGWIHDISHSYSWAWILSSVCTIIAFFLYLLIRKETK
jgi:MFS family permease